MLVAPQHLAGVVPGHLRHQNRLHTLRTPGLYLRCILQLPVDELLKPLLLLGFRHLPFHRTRPRTFPWIPVVHVGLDVSHFLHRRDRLLEFLLGLTGESHHDVHCEGHRRNAGFNSIYQRKITLSCISPVHQLQDPAVPALHRHMQVLGNALLLCDHLDQVVREILRMRALEPYPLHVVAHGADLLQKTREIAALVRIGIHVLPEQRYLTHTFRIQEPHFLQDLLRRTRDLPSADVRHDAVRTEVVASVHDGHIG